MNTEYKVLLYLLFFSCLTGWNCSNIENGSKGKSDTVWVGKDSLSESEYTAWLVEKSKDLSVERKIGEVAYLLKFTPSELMQLKQGDTSNYYQDYILFNLRIELNDKSDILKFPSPDYRDMNQRVQYLSFDMQRFISLVIDKKSYPCMIYNYEKNYGIKPYAEFTIGFQKAPLKSGPVTVTIEDHYFGSGQVNFSFENSIINNVPKIKSKA